MTRAPTSDDRLRVLIAGGGVAALEALLALRAAAEERVDITLLTPEAELTYRPLSVLAPFRMGETRRFPVTTLTDAASATAVQGRLHAVDTEGHAVLSSVGTLGYDVLLLAIGAEPVDAVPGALTFRGPPDEGALASLLARMEGRGGRIAFVVPGGATWPLPLYELALLTRWHLAEEYASGVDVVIVTPEESPLAIFGPQASKAVDELLEIRSIELVLGATATAFEDGELHVLGDGIVPADAAVALPRLEGIPIRGIPTNRSGFVETDAYGGVRGVDDVYAAGDMTAFAVKQGGIAAQQADAAASAIAVRAGAPIALQPFRPVIRGLLLTGGVSRFLRAEASGRGSTVDLEPLWWPPAKIVGRHLAPFLAEHADIVEEPTDDFGPSLPVDVELEYEAGAVKPLASI